MPDLDFQIEGAEPVPYAAAPLLAFKIRLKNEPATELIHNVVLRAQIQIDVPRRSYSPREREQLLDLFGEIDRWSQTLRNILWGHANVVIPAFEGTTLANIEVPCTFDFNIAATKYFHGLVQGDLPLIFLFSGSVFYRGEDDTLQVAPISWEKEATFRLPVATWKELMELYYPNSAWLNIRRDVFERLYQFKARSHIPTWEQAIERVLDGVEESAGR